MRSDTVNSIPIGSRIFSIQTTVISRKPQALVKLFFAARARCGLCLFVGRTFGRRPGPRGVSESGRSTADAGSTAGASLTLVQIIHNVTISHRQTRAMGCAGAGLPPGSGDTGREARIRSGKFKHRCYSDYLQADYVCRGRPRPRQIRDAQYETETCTRLTCTRLRRVRDCPSLTCTRVSERVAGSSSRRMGVRATAAEPRPCQPAGSFRPRPAGHLSTLLRRYKVTNWAPPVSERHHA